MAAANASGLFPMMSFRVVRSPLSWASLMEVCSESIFPAESRISEAADVRLSCKLVSFSRTLSPPSEAVETEEDKLERAEGQGGLR